MQFADRTHDRRINAVFTGWSFDLARCRRNADRDTDHCEEVIGLVAATEEQAALSAGWVPVTLGPRTLRAETAPLAALAALTAFGPRC